MSSSPDTTVRQECPACGTENDSFYTYCRQCLAELPSGSSSQSIA